MATANRELVVSALCIVPFAYFYFRDPKKNQLMFDNFLIKKEPRIKQSPPVVQAAAPTTANKLTHDVLDEIESALTPPDHYSMKFSAQEVDSVMRAIKQAEDAANNNNNKG